MLSLLDRVEPYKALLDSLLSGSFDGGPIGLPRAARMAIAAALYRDLRRPTILIVPRVDQAQKQREDLTAWMPNSIEASSYPEPTPLPYDRAPWGENSRNGRLSILDLLHTYSKNTRENNGQLLPPVVVVSVRALVQKSIPRREYIAHTRQLGVGQLIRLEKLLEAWLNSGYRPAHVVEEPGTFCRRGGILDICPSTFYSSFENSFSGKPVGIRIELFGDEIESIRSFDLATQRTLAGQESVVIPPAREALPRYGPRLSQMLADVSGDGDWREDLVQLGEGSPFPDLEFYLPYFYQQPGSLLDHLPSDSLILLDDMNAVEDEYNALRHRAEKLRDERLASGAIPSDYPSPLFDWETIFEKINSCMAVDLGGLVDGVTSSELPGAFTPGPRYGGQVKPLIDNLIRLYLNGERTVIVSRQAARLADLWRENGPSIGPVNNVVDVPANGTVTFVQGALGDGFTLLGRTQAGESGRTEILRPAPLLHLYTDAEVFGWSRPEPRQSPRPRAIAPESHFADITPGSLVVHIDHGIGRYEGLVTKKLLNLAHEYLLVTYADGDQLYVPTHQADRLSRYVGADSYRPTLHRLGGAGWSQDKTRALKAIEEYADELLELYSARATVQGHAFSSDTSWQAELEASFPYIETDDQTQAIEQVKADMERPKPMDRLVCGDVGYGKTEVALRAAFKAVMDGKQVGVLVPTTVLAQQHFNNFRQRLATFPVEIRMLSRFRSRPEQSRILTELAAGKVDIIIGTHRLLQKDVTFKDLGLLIIDEEQRFGVAHKEILKQLRTEVDVLTMTATPIPRTLYMSLTGVRDISLISTPPEERLPVETHIGPYDPNLVRRAILRELDRRGQVFFVHNRVQTIKSIARNLQQLVPEARLGIGHGQMNEHELEQIMLSFVAGEIDVLVSTSIIENGLDIPNANTIIIDRASLFGLSQLYQLRGRVGRGARRAYSYFFFRNANRLTPEARARLETLAEHTDLGAGYNIAMRDLEIRGTGEILGTRQHGHISAVGFDLYTRLLARAVQQKKEHIAASSERVFSEHLVSPELMDIVTIELPMTGYIPEEYISEPQLRFRLYRRMAGLNTLEAVDNMAVELTDRFGPIPDPVDNLLFQIRIKLLASKAGVEAITTIDGQLCIRKDGLEQIDRMALQRYLASNVRVSKKAIWHRPGDDQSLPWKVTLVQTLERLASWSPA
ncbi:MAG: transcription-repair coupling factor [Anaerolineales bacterium]|nr:transcription-repair coupling factor [Anaerolineales bacterium]